MLAPRPSPLAPRPSPLAPLAVGESNPLDLVQQFETGLCALEPRIARQFARHLARLAFLADARELMCRT